jgi:EAL and modified HD-GYP domain-containing signal transduction protein
MGARDVFVARQPILDVDQRVCAYELLFRAGLDDRSCPGMNLNDVSRQIMHDTFMTVGVDKLLSGRPAFVNFTADDLLSGWVHALPSDSVVIELLETIEVTDAVVDACRVLKQQGFRIGLDDFVYQKQWDPLLEMADIIKVSFRDTLPEERRRLASWLGQRGLQLLAEQVETRDEYDEAVELGYSYFQGYFLFRPETVAGRELKGFKVSSVRLLQAIAKPDLPRDVVEDLIKRDASLSHKLLRYLNSACFAFCDSVESIQHALALLGDDNLRRWISVIGLGGIGQDKPQELMVTSAVRGRFCEALAPLVGLELRGPELFLLGMLSLLDTLLDRPMHEALEPLHLSPDLNHALLGGASELRDVLDLVVAYERADWRTVAGARRINGAERELPQHYLAAVEWASGLTGEYE